MTNQEINITIAESMGWVWKINKHSLYFQWVNPQGISVGMLGEKDDKSKVSLKFPDYASDLNAMHKVEKHIINMENWEMCTYETQLEHMTNSWQWHATAAQRAEAYLRTIGKWGEGK